MNFDREIGRLVTQRDENRITPQAYISGMKQVEEAIIRYLSSLGDTVAVDSESGEVREIRNIQ